MLGLLKRCFYINSMQLIIRVALYRNKIIYLIYYDWIGALDARQTGQGLAGGSSYSGGITYCNVWKLMYKAYCIRNTFSIAQIYLVLLCTSWSPRRLWLPLSNYPPTHSHPLLMEQPECMSRRHRSGSFGAISRGSSARKWRWVFVTGAYSYIACTMHLEGSGIYSGNNKMWLFEAKSADCVSWRCPPTPYISDVTTASFRFSHLNSSYG